MNEATGVNEPAGPAGDSALREPVTAVCCSGGGIRSASFNLGALQELGAQDVLHDAKHILGVSGGAYIAAARSVVAAKLPRDDGAYARGSVEEDHLRDNSHYLLPDGKTALRGAMFLVLGLAFNLTLLLAWIFILGHTLGWLFEWQGVVRGLLIGEPRFVARWWTWMVPAVLGGAAVLVFLFPVPPPSGPKPGGRGTRDWGEWKSRTVWILAVSALVSALAFLAAPRAIQGLYDVGRHDGGNLGMVVRGAGFATPSGCKDAAKTRLATAKPGAQDLPEICGVPLDKRGTTGAAAVATAKDASKEAPKGTAPQAGGLFAFFAALVAVVRGAMGRLRGVKAAASGASKTGSTKRGSAEDSSTKIAAVEQPSGLLSRAAAMVTRVMLPWLGSAIVVALLGYAFLRWTADGSIGGYGGRELWSVAVAAGILLVGRVVTDINQTSMHRFYRDRLAHAYSVERSVDAQGPKRAEEHPERMISEIMGAEPELVVCAAANVSAAGEVPPGRAAISYTFTPESVSLSAKAPDGTGALQKEVQGRQSVRVPANEFERAVGRPLSRDGTCHFTLFDAVAISGAAVAPLMGKMTRRAQRILLTVANVRLGIWLPSPRLFPSADPTTGPKELSWRERRMRRLIEKRVDEKRRNWLTRTWYALLWRAAQPNVRLLLEEAIGSSHVGQSWLYVSDGGHYDNLGLVEAFRRGATTVYAFDASGDSVTTWNTLGQALALARSDCGVEVDIDPKEMVEDGTLAHPWVKGTFTYTWDEPNRPPREGALYLCKLGVWADAPWDVRAYAMRHPTFPTDSTLQQLYDDEEFEAYRALGQAAAHTMLAAKSDERRGDVIATDEVVAYRTDAGDILLEETVTIAEEP